LIHSVENWIDPPLHPPQALAWVLHDWTFHWSARWGVGLMWEAKGRADRESTEQSINRYCFIYEILGIHGYNAGRLHRLPPNTNQREECATIFWNVTQCVVWQNITLNGIKNGVFWDVTLCGSCKVRRLGGT
jgi:hypothetical protein